MTEDQTEPIESTEEEPSVPLSDQLQTQLDQMAEKVEQAHQAGYLRGREDQMEEDAYYVRRVSELARLLQQAEDEIQRLRKS